MEAVTLATLCKELDLDPKLTRAKLRALVKAKKLKKPAGQWEWPKNQVAHVKQLLRPQAPASSAKKPKKAPAKKKPEQATTPSVAVEPAS